MHRHAGRLQGGCALQRQPFGRTGLAGVGQQHGVGIGSHRAACGKLLALGRGAAFLFAPVQVQHPAGNRKAGQGQAAEEHHDPARHAEEAAHVQRVERRLRLAAHRHLRIRLVLEHGAGLLVDGHAAACAHVRRIFRGPHDLQRRGGALGDAQEGHAPVGRGAFKGGPAGGQVHRRRLAPLGQPGGGRFAHHARDAEPAIDRAAHHVETPVNAGEREDHVAKHHPGAHDRVQAPQERAALEPEVELEPGAPVADAARPAQVQAAQRQSQQAQGQDAERDAAGVARQQQVAVQRIDPLEHFVVVQRRQQGAGVGIEEDRFAAGFALGGRQAHARGAARLRVDDDAGDARLRVQHLGGGGDLRWRQYRCILHRDIAHAGVQKVQQLFAERQDRAGQSDQDQNGAGGDADKPVQLEPELFHRSTFTPNLTRRGMPELRRVPAPAQYCLSPAFSTLSWKLVRWPITRVT